jgi:hypothetical protein
VKTSRVFQDHGSILIEVVAFAVVGFGLVLTLGFQVLEQERKVLDLQSIARNSMRAHLLNPFSDLDHEVERYQLTSKLWSEESISVQLKCVPVNCEATNSLVWLKLSSSGLDAQAFGVKSG